MKDQLALARLLSVATRMLVDRMHETLHGAGHEDLRPAHGFALLAIAGGDATTAALAERLGMTKQGASKLVGSLEPLGYITRAPHPEDARARLLVLTSRGEEVLRISEAAQADVEAEWRDLTGAAEVSTMRAVLERAVDARYGDELPGFRPVW